MEIQPQIIDHLGINMYTNMHAVLSELVANSWDADADNVYISSPDVEMSSSYEIVVRDDGSGMTFDELNKLYLTVGRDRRKETGDALTTKGRRTLGRKGIGKFSAFGVAKKVVIKSVKDKKLIEFEMDIDKIKETKDQKYKPKITREEETEEDNGVTVILKNLKRTRKVDLQTLREGIAKRFVLIGEGFTVHLNDTPITSEDIRVEDVEYKWSINESISDEHLEWVVKGEIRSKKGTIREPHNRGVALFARGKLIQEPTFFGAVSGKEFAYPHIFGELEAEFLDGVNDNIATNRSEINRESEEGQTMMEWGKQKLTQISVIWNENRITDRIKVVTDKPEFSEWFKGLTEPEQKLARNIFNSICKNSNLDQERIVDLAGYIKDTFDYRAFQDLAKSIDEAPPEDSSKIIDLFRQWEHVESREMYRILKGRLSAIKKLRDFIQDDAREVPDIHDYIKKFPWILNPKWTMVQEEATYKRLLKEEFGGKEKNIENKRIDFLCFTSWNDIIVIELKRPGHAISKKDLDQLREYVLFIQERKRGTAPELAERRIFGYLICEKMQQNAAFQAALDDNKKADRYVLQYSDLATYAERLHQEYIDKYDEIQKKTKPKS